MKIIFSDLDGTLLDHDTYSFQEARPALELIKQKKIPLIICTSKTRAEIEYYRRLLKNSHPFISENGGALFIPSGYFDFNFTFQKKINNYLVIELGMPYKTLRRSLQEIKKAGFEIKGFGDMSIEEVAEDTGLSLEQAELAKQREYDEAFRLIEGEEEKLIKFIKEKGLNYTKGGRYFHLMGNNDKGKAVRIMTELLKQKYTNLITIGLGDSENDFKMLDEVTIPYLVMRKNKSYASDKYQKARGIGPQGWNLAVKKEIKNDL
ncbi:MAG: mannosyl-3-phosphoglycerate phosphatase [Candidatus Aminicenantales bacterium]